MAMSVAMDQDPLIAVSAVDVKKFGCPHCGFRSGHTTVMKGGTSVWICAECGQDCCILAPGVIKSEIGFKGDHHISYPRIQNHPREGTPAHGTPDKRPEAGGEFFTSRGIGKEFNLECFVCGAQPGLMANIAAFVRCKAAGERVVELFKKGARLDYRDFEPDRVQVKVGACSKHEPCLETLHSLVVQDNVVSKRLIRESKNLRSPKARARAKKRQRKA